MSSNLSVGYLTEIDQVYLLLFKIGSLSILFIYFRLFHTVDSKSYMPIMRLELQISGFGRNH